ncbi:MAG TPA: ubiquinol-cytochrome c reductase iron-sulfur subunit N-terminal domain-containing protein [Thermoanaerobaculia bacterium]
MKEEITRRRFLGTAATLGAGAVAAPAAASPLVHPPGWSGTARVEKIATTCEMCFWRCGVLASVSGGKVVRVEGNPTIPRARAACARAGTPGPGCCMTRTV